MIQLTSTDSIEVITESAYTIDCYVSYIDLNTSTSAATPGRTNTQITTATTTTILSAPSSGIVRKVNTISIKNSDGYSNQITVNVDVDGYTTELDSRYLAPNDAIVLNPGEDVILPASAFPFSTYHTVIAAYGDGNPSRLLSMVNNNSGTSATPTNISVSVARCCTFRIPFDITVNEIWFNCPNTVAEVYKGAIYNYETKTKITDTIALEPSSNWSNVAISPSLALTKNTMYVMAVSVVTTGTTAGILCMAPNVSTTTGRIIYKPEQLPGNLSVNMAFIDSYCFQFAVSTGVLPDNMPATVAPAAWSGGMPAFWLEA